MKMFIFSCVFAILAISTVMAQDVLKPVVTVHPFTGESFTKTEINQVRNNVIRNLQATKRLKIVDLSTQAAVKAEEKRRQSESAMRDMRNVKDIATLMANYIIVGSLDALIEGTTEVTDYKTGQKMNKPTAELTYSFQIIDPSTGSISDTKTYKSSSTADTPAAARAGAIAGSSENMKAMIEEVFPVIGTIVAIAEKDKKGVKATKVYIDLGSEYGIAKGQLFNVMAIVDIAGEKAMKTIGSLKADEVMSPTRSECSVKEGGDQIVLQMAEGSKLVVKTRDTKNVITKFFR